MSRIVLSLSLCLVVSCAGNTNSKTDNGGSSGQTGGDGGGGSSGGGAGGSGGEVSSTGGQSGKPGSGGAGGSAGESGAGGTGGVDAATDRGGGAGRDGGSPPADKPADTTPTTGGSVYVYVGGVPATITAFKLDLTSGALTKVGTANGANGPTWMTFSPDKKFLYATNEYAVPSTVGAFSIDPATGGLKAVGSFVTTASNGSAHIAVHPSGKWVVSPGYDNGHVTVLSVKTDGSIDKQTDDVMAGTYPHSAWFDESGAFMFVPCLGSNFVAQYKFQDGMLTPNSPATIAQSGGPRHMAFGPGYDYAYLLTETSSSIVVYKFDKAGGKLTTPPVQTIAASSTGSGSESSHIVLHPSGKFIYASNRNKDNSIGIFAIDAQTGKLTSVGWEKGGTTNPRGFTVDPTGGFLIVASEDGGQVLVFKIDQATGKTTAVGSPVTVSKQPQFVGAIQIP